MAEAAVEAEHLLVVSDADGMLLRIQGDERLRNRAADEMNFIDGALWSESGAGTNTIGTAVAAQHAAQVFAAEHFTEPVQRWTCAAAPVSDPDTGALLGVIDQTGDFSGVNPHSLSVVVATASAVEDTAAAGSPRRCAPSCTAMTVTRPAGESWSPTPPDGRVREPSARSSISTTTRGAGSSSGSTCWPMPSR